MVKLVVTAALITTLPLLAWARERACCRYSCQQVGCFGIGQPLTQLCPILRVVSSARIIAMTPSPVSSKDQPMSLSQSPNAR